MNLGSRSGMAVAFSVSAPVRSCSSSTPRVCASRPWVSMSAGKSASAVVVGCGPIGAYAALHLERIGYSPVTVLEARESPEEEADAKHRYRIVLFGKTRAALDRFSGLYEQLASRGIRDTRSSMMALYRKQLVIGLMQHAKSDIHYRFQRRVSRVSRTRHIRGRRGDVNIRFSCCCARRKLGRTTTGS